jgi:hypothetical protein
MTEPVKRVAILNGIATRATFRASHLRITEPSRLENMSKTTKSIMEHALYHERVLNLSVYELYVRHDQVKSLMANPQLSAMHERGFIRLLTHTRPELMLHSSYYYQNIYYNCALLRYWLQNVQLVVFDFDEYVVFNNPEDESYFSGLLATEPYIKLKPVAAVCEPVKDCERSGATVPLDSRDNFTWIYAYQPVPGGQSKYVFSPTFASSCACPHWIEGFEPFVPDETRVFLAHFKNIFDERVPHKSIENSSLISQHTLDLFKYSVGHQPPSVTNDAGVSPLTMGRLLYEPYNTSSGARPRCELFPPNLPNWSCLGQFS